MSCWLTSMRMFGAVLLVLSSTTLAAAAPNIVVIMTDDQEDTGSMAYMPKVHSLLAERGVTFTNSFVNVSLCCPSRASFLTGQAAHNHGIKSNKLPSGGWQVFKDKEENALPVWLKAAGYKTALLGKYLNRYSGRAPGCHRVGTSGTRSTQKKGTTTIRSTKMAGSWSSTTRRAITRPTFL
jgi:hypothetical protein